MNVFDTFHHLRGNELLAGAVCVHNSFDKVLWHLIIVGQQLLSVLRQAVSAIAKAGVVITVTDAWIKTYAIYDFAGVQTAAFRIGIKFVEIRHSESQIRIGK